MAKSALLLLLSALALAASVARADYVPIKAAFTFVVDGNFTGQPIQTGESSLASGTTISVAALRNFAAEAIREEFGIEFSPSPFDGYAQEASPYPNLRRITPIKVAYPYSVVSLYDSTGALSNDFDRTDDRPSALLTEYAVSVNTAVLQALQSQGINPIYGGRYGTVATQKVVAGDVIAAGVYNITQVRYNNQQGINRGKGHAADAECNKRVVSRRWSFLSLIPGPSYSFAKNGTDAGSYSLEAFKTYSPEYGYGLQQLYVIAGPLVNGTQSISYHNHAEFPGTFGVPALPVLSPAVAF